jgi:hypothetical protein
MSRGPQDYVDGTRKPKFHDGFAALRHFRQLRLGDGKSAPVSSAISKARAIVFLRITNHAILFSSFHSPANPRHAQDSQARPVVRGATAERKLRILKRLTAGVSVAHIARVEDLTIRRVSQVIAKTLAKSAREETEAEIFRPVTR